jgi:D-psicose/D-tagatose/L-ribulose 3-epimerase
MKLAMHNWMRPEPIEVTIERLGRLGYDAIEISGEPARYDIGQVKELLAQHNVQCWGSVSLMTEGRDLIHEDKYVRVGTIAYLKDTIKMIRDLGGQIFCIVPSTVGKVKAMADPETEWGWAVEGFKELSYFAGEHRVRIGIEPLNRFETNFINRTDQGLALANEVGNNVGVTIDTFHLNIEEADMLAAIRSAGSQLVDFHVADNNRMPPGSGSLNWRAIIDTLRSIGYDGCVTSEFVMPIDRSPLVKQSGRQGQGAEAADTTPGMEKFLRDHGTGLLSAQLYDELVRQTAEHIKPLL